MADPDIGVDAGSHGASGVSDEARYMVYSAIADAMPTEGRDYLVEVSGRGRSASVRLVPRTAFGAEFCRHAAESIRIKFGARPRVGAGSGETGKEKENGNGKQS